MRLLIGLLVFAGVTVWQVRAIAGSRYPGLRAAEALGLIIPLYLLLFASTYFLMERASAANFTQPLTRTDALYFSGDRLHDGGLRGHHRQIRDRPGRAHRPDARRPRTAGRRRTGAAGGRAARPATTIRRGSMTHVQPPRDASPWLTTQQPARTLTGQGGAEYVLTTGGRASAPSRCLGTGQGTGAARQGQHGHRLGQGHHGGNPVDPAECRRFHQQRFPVRHLCPAVHLPVHDRGHRRRRKFFH